MAREYFCAYHSYLDSMEMLSDVEKGRLFTACLLYSKTGEAPQLTGNERFVFPMFKAQIDRDKENYSARCRKQSENIKKRWDTKVYNGKNGIPNNTKHTKEKEKEKIYTPPVSPSRGKRKAEFVPPTLEEIEAYRKERGSSVSAKDFFDYFDAGNWVDSEGKPVLNWKQKFITWDKNARNRSGGGSQEVDPYADVI